MNALKKERTKNVLKYTWPIYIVTTIAVIAVMSFIFNATHQTPAYKTLTLFISGESKDTKKLKDDLLKKFEDKELKSVSTIIASPNEGHYYSKLSIPGFNSADILIIPISKLDNLQISSFGLDLSNELITSYYDGYTLYQQDEVNYGIKLNKEKVQEYVTLPSEDCYMILNGKSENLGKYSLTPNEAHDNALQIVKDWGI